MWTLSKPIGTILVLLSIFLFSIPAYAKYGGGSGTADDPYQIATAADLLLLGDSPQDYDKHFILTGDIDLDPKLPGGKVFDKAVIAPDVNETNEWCNFEGSLFTGRFDGNGHTISHLTIKGWSYLGLFGLLGYGAVVKDLGVVDVSITDSGSTAGGLVGSSRGTVTHCYSTGVVSGSADIGGLVGWNYLRGTVTHCYSTGMVSSTRYDGSVGGLVGYNYEGTVTRCYSTGAVSSPGGGGGLLGGAYKGSVAGCFWDTQTSGRSWSEGGTGKTTAEMQTAKTFLDAGWDFMGETANGTEDIWWVNEGQDYPRLEWESWASSPDPYDGSLDVIQTLTLRWRAGAGAAEHDVYFGEDETATAAATHNAPGVYRGRQAVATTTYDPGVLEWAKTYYWRIDEVNPDEPDSPWKGKVWSFGTSDLPVVTIVDDFESYTDNMDAGEAMFQTWLDGLGFADYAGNGTGSIIGYENRPFRELTIVHGGRQSAPLDYKNVNLPYYSETERTWEAAQDWTIEGADTLTLYFRADPNNSPDPLYVGIEDSVGRVAVVVHPDADAVLTTEWQKWHIALAGVRAAGVDVAAVKKMVIAVGDRKNPQPGGTGRIYIDDIRLTYRNLVVAHFNGDGYMDFTDFCIFGQHWLETDSSFFCGGGGTDLTNDGFVDFADLKELADNWLATK